MLRRRLRTLPAAACTFESGHLTLVSDAGEGEVVSKKVLSIIFGRSYLGSQIVVGTDTVFLFIKPQSYRNRAAQPTHVSIVLPCGRKPVNW